MPLPTITSFMRFMSLLWVPLLRGALSLRAPPMQKL
jgi:hypothetical protein